MPYLTNTPLDKALAQYRNVLQQAGVASPVETVDVTASAGRLTAEAVYARRSVPHYLASAMDGIAVRAADTFGATETTPVVLQPPQYKSVDTGDALPAGCDAVVMIEDVIWQGEQVCLIGSATPWQHIRQIGEDFCAGDMLLPARSSVTPAVMGILLAGGVFQINVLRRPVVQIIPTGDEIVPPTAAVKPGEIPEFNATVFAAWLRQRGAEVHIRPIVPDDPLLLEQALRQALAEGDWVLVLAGSSAGRGDFTASVIAAIGQVVVHGLAIRPGKPAILAVCGHKPILGIPGYPVSGLVVLEHVLGPMLTEFAGLPPVRRPCVQAALSRRVLSSLKYQEFIRVRLSRLAVPEAAFAATPLERGAGLLGSFAKADGLLTVPQNSEGYEAGTVVAIELLRDLDAISSTLGIIGSHDPLIDELADLFHLSATTLWPGQHLMSAHVGSMGGLMAIRRGEAQIAGIHLLDSATGRYNVPMLQRLFPDGSVVLIEGVRRTQGLLVVAGNPKKISGLCDLSRPGLRYVNRQAGSGTRLLLDDQLKRLQISPSAIDGYGREELTHSAVAAQIAAGSADAGLGIHAAAGLFALDFIPVAEENYDFAVARSALDWPQVRLFLELLVSDALRRRLDKLGGYRLEQPGRLIWPESAQTESGAEANNHA
jgi:putative molybdopterin biosynthesis protein